MDSLSFHLVQKSPVTSAGLQAPLGALVPAGDDVTPPDKAFKQGRTLPLKLQLSCGATPPQIVALVRTSGTVDLEVVDLDSGAANDNGVLFHFSDPDWVYNLSTKGLLSGASHVTTCAVAWPCQTAPPNRRESL